MYLSTKHNMVIYDHPAPQQIKAQLPSAVPINGHHVAIPFTMRDMQLARLIGLPALSPIERHYDWPGQFKPKSHQVEMASFLTLHPRSMNLSAMRTGKTMAAAWAADYLMDLGLVQKALIVCTLSNMQRVWDNELYRHLLEKRRAAILYGSIDQRLEQLSTPADFYIINHDGICVGSKRGPRGIELGPVARQLAERSDIQLVIVDEATAFKVSGTRRWRVLRHICEGKPYVWLLTGTPTPNAPTDAWAFQKLLRPHATESYIGFRDRTMFRVSQFKWVAKKEAPEIVSKFLQPAIRFSREDCIDIPPITIEQAECELSPTQKKAYDQMKRGLSLLVESGERINAVNEAVLRLKLLQISMGAIYGPDKEVHHTDCGPRLQLLMDLLEEADGKVLVFAPLTSVVDLLYKELKKAKYAVEIIYGNTSAKKRIEILNWFTIASSGIIVGDPGCIAHGLDLSVAGTIVWFGPTDKLEIYQQANARIDGPNQTRKQVAIQIASTKEEKEIYKRLDEKRTLQGLILDMVRQ